MTVGLTREDLERLLEAAEADGPRSAALITLLAYNGLRVDEALSRDVEHLGHQLGHRVLRLSRKGGRDALEPLSLPSSAPSTPTFTSAPPARCSSTTKGIRSRRQSSDGGGRHNHRQSRPTVDNPG